MRNHIRYSPAISWNMVIYCVEWSNSYNMLNWISINSRQHSHFVISNIQFIKCVALLVSPLLVAIFITDDSAQVNRVTSFFLVIRRLLEIYYIIFNFIIHFYYIRYLTLGFIIEHTIFETIFLNVNQLKKKMLYCHFQGQIVPDHSS